MQGDQFSEMDSKLGFYAKIIIWGLGVCQPRILVNILMDTWIDIFSNTNSMFALLRFWSKDIFFFQKIILQNKFHINVFVAFLKNMFPIWQCWAKTLCQNKFTFGEGEANILHIAHITWRFPQLEYSFNSDTGEWSLLRPSPLSFSSHQKGWELFADQLWATSPGYLSNSLFTVLGWPSFLYLNACIKFSLLFDLEWLVPSFLSSFFLLNYYTHTY